MAKRGKPEAIAGEINPGMIEGVDRNFDEVFAQLLSTVDMPEGLLDGDLLIYDSDTETFVRSATLPVTNLAGGEGASASTFWRGDGVWAAPVSGGDWDTTVTKTADQGVTNSAVLVDAADMAFPVTAGSVWRIQVWPLFSATNATPDFQFFLTLTAGTMFGIYHNRGMQGTSSVQELVEGINGTIAVPFSRNWAASADVRTGYIELFATFSAAANLKFQFAQQFATAATTTTLKAGSFMRGERLF